jgi:hypothetical protein
VKLTDRYQTFFTRLADAAGFARLTAGMDPLFEVTFMTTASTAHILRTAADVLNAQPNLQLDVVTVVRIAVGAGRANHERAEQVLAELAAQLDLDGDPPSALQRWSAVHTREQIGMALHEAADMSEVIA